MLTARGQHISFLVSVAVSCMHIYILLLSLQKLVLYEQYVVCLESSLVQEDFLFRSLCDIV